MRQTAVGTFGDHAAAVLAARAIEARGYDNGCVHVSPDRGSTALSGTTCVLVEVADGGDVDAACEALRAEGARDVDRRSGEGSDGRGSSAASRAYGMHEDAYREHFASGRSGSGDRYEDYEPAYRYGHSIGSDSNYAGRSWEQVEPMAQRDWESRRPGNAWERFKAAVRHGWERMTGHDDSDRHRSEPPGGA